MSTLQTAVTGTVSGLANNQQINAIAGALATMSQGASAPTTTSTGLTSTAGLWWHDTANNLIKVRNQADTAWIPIGTLDEANGAFRSLGIPSTAVNVTSSRALGTVYTNTGTGTKIVTANVTSIASAVDMGGYVGGNLLTSYRLYASSLIQGVMLWVPPGLTYEISVDASASVYSWYEWS